MNDLENNISKRIHEFDIISLFRLLASMDYRPDEIRFRSNNSICSQAALIHAISFRREPVREVLVTMNMGLLSSQSPLPNYFREKMDTEVNNSLVDFIWYFDHHLIQDYIFNIYPEINASFFPSWELTKRRYLQVLDLTSCSTLHWLFQTVFPEVGVTVEKVLLSDELPSRELHLGKTKIGGAAVFGSKARVPIHGRMVTLNTEEETSNTQTPWPQEIKGRLESLLFPILRPAGIDLEINLVLKSQKRWARLHRETYLGYDRIKNGHESYRRIRIFRGHVGEFHGSGEAGVE